MVAPGHPNKRIAMLLNLSVSTISTHVRRIFAKLGVSSRSAMVARLLEAGEGGPGFGAKDAPAFAADPGRAPAHRAAIEVVRVKRDAC